MSIVQAQARIGTIAMLPIREHELIITFQSDINTLNNTQHMKKSTHLYSLLNNAGDTVQIDLNAEQVTCTKTNQTKRFYHKYLAGLIERQYDNNIDLFRSTYTSRASVDPRERKAKQIQQRIDRLNAQLNKLRAEKDQLTSLATPVE